MQPWRCMKCTELHEAWIDSQTKASATNSTPRDVYRDALDHTHLRYLLFAAHVRRCRPLARHRGESLPHEEIEKHNRRLRDVDQARHYNRLSGKWNVDRFDYHMRRCDAEA